MANKTLSVALLSGKGGVGKTNITLNMACALYQMGFKNLLMDCDLGLANLDVLLGITPEGNLQNTLLGEAGIGDVLYHVETQGFDVLPAASGVPELTELQPDMRNMLLDRYCSGISAMTRKFPKPCAASSRLCASPPAALRPRTYKIWPHACKGCVLAWPTGWPPERCCSPYPQKDEEDGLKTTRTVYLVA